MRRYFNLTHFASYSINRFRIVLQLCTHSTVESHHQVRHAVTLHLHNLKLVNTFVDLLVHNSDISLEVLQSVDVTIDAGFPGQLNILLKRTNHNFSYFMPFRHSLNPQTACHVFPYLLIISPECQQSVECTQTRILAIISGQRAMWWGGSGHDDITQMLTTSNLYDKIRTLCKECRLSTVPSSSRLHPEEYLHTLELIRKEVLRLQEVEQDYGQLENLLQKNQMEVRKHIAAQKQYELYIDTLKSQVETLQKEKMELLENSKEHIKLLKKHNEELYLQLHGSPQRINHQERESAQKSRKSGRKSHSKSKNRSIESRKQHQLQGNRRTVTEFNKPSHSLKHILKTEHLQRSPRGRKEAKKSHHNSVYSAIDSHQSRTALKYFRTHQKDKEPWYSGQKERVQLGVGSRGGKQKGKRSPNKGYKGVGSKRRLLKGERGRKANSSMHSLLGQGYK